ncbi:MAG: hypothetical protein LBQ49_02440 [Rickettsiales bacterium]|jgi:hypothetical protein|nr:hypothetical protein [Rickettsiales bacterium]
MKKILILSLVCFIPALAAADMTADEMRLAWGHCCGLDYKCKNASTPTQCEIKFKSEGKYWTVSCNKNGGTVNCTRNVADCINGAERSSANSYGNTADGFNTTTKRQICIDGSWKDVTAGAQRQTSGMPADFVSYEKDTCALLAATEQLLRNNIGPSGTNCTQGNMGAINNEYNMISTAVNFWKTLVGRDGNLYQKESEAGRQTYGLCMQYMGLCKEMSANSRFADNAEVKARWRQRIKHIRSEIDRISRIQN